MTGQPAFSPLIAVFLAAALSFVLTGLATWYARRSGLLDHPGDRHSHTLATPRGGGAGLIAAYLLVSLWLIPHGPPAWWLSCVLPGMVVLAVTGWWDDHASLSVRVRLFVQLVVSVYLIGCAADAGWMQGVIWMIISGLFVIWMINLYNFMDGSNGMAGLQGIFASLVLAGLFYHSGDVPYAMASLLVAGCCVGFLPWNLGRAKVFMGDVGSLSLGFLFAALLLRGAGTGAFSYPVALIVMLLFLTDASLTLLWRVIRREQWYNAHRQHLYQRMIAHGWTHGQVAMFYQAINLILILPGIMIAVSFPALAWAVALALTLILILGWHLLLNSFGEPAQAG
jgi:UDP-N-acetylmuramyl pentapeptide phosphotransferase/UDP-N-acetylglucosamine-1-phosphate transferase